MYPLKNCEITASWKNGIYIPPFIYLYNNNKFYIYIDTGLYADTITITTRKKQEKKVKENGSDTAD